jgi:hypothetical protein
MQMHDDISKELCRYPYHNQSDHRAEYVATQLTRAINGCLYGVYVVKTGERLVAPCSIYSSASNESDAKELAYRIANDLPRPRTLYCGKSYSGVSKRSAEIWILKYKSKYENDYHMSISNYEGKFAVDARPKDWGLLIN